MYEVYIYACRLYDNIIYIFYDAYESMDQRSIFRSFFNLSSLMAIDKTCIGHRHQGQMYVGTRGVAVTTQKLKNNNYDQFFAIFVLYDKNLYTNKVNTFHLNLF